MAINPFDGFQVGRQMTPAQMQFLRNWGAQQGAESMWSGGEGANSAPTFSGSYKDPTTGLWFTPESGTGGYSVYDGSGPNQDDKSRLNGRIAYSYDSDGNFGKSGTIQGLTKTSEFGPLMQAGAILAAPFAVGGLQAAGLMGGVNPVLAAEAAAGAGAGMGAAGAAGTGVTVGGAMSTGMPVGTELGALGSGGTAAMGAGAAGSGGAASAGGTMSGAGGAMSGFNWSDLIGPATQLLGGALGSDAAKDAANAQLQSTREAAALNEPFRQGGMAGMNRLLDMLGLSKNTGAEGYGSLMKDPTLADFQADPGYQFRLSEGQKALERSAAARGGLYSGRAMKDATRFGQDLGSQEYGNYFNRFQALRQNKLNPLQSLMGAGQTSANTIGDLTTQGGNARAAGMVGSANAWTNALSGGMSMYQNQQQQNQNNVFQNALMKRWGA